MSKLFLDETTKEQASDYADTEAEIYGYKRGSEQWKKAYSYSLSHSVSTMTTGINPRNFRYKVYTKEYPEVFGPAGFAGIVAKNFMKQDGSKGVPSTDIEGRVLSSVMNLIKLFENGVMETKNTTSKNTQGKIPSEEMSELQFPNKEDFSSKEEFQAAMKDVLYNWFARDIIANAVLETLRPFWTLTKDDVDSILGAITVKDANMQEVIKEGREELIKKLRVQVGMKYSLPYKKAVMS